MRWDSQSKEADAARRLPGYRDAALVRTFDAPEALDIRFYEVVARSALNRVPKQSQMPFRFTINSADSSVMPAESLMTLSSTKKLLATAFQRCESTRESLTSSENRNSCKQNYFRGRA